MTSPTEADVKQEALDWLSGLGWQVAHGPDIALEMPNVERDDYGQVVLEQRVGNALVQLNPALPASALDDAFRELNDPEGSTTPPAISLTGVGCAPSTPTGTAWCG